MISYTLVSDGSSDQALIPIIDWTITANFPEIAFAGVAATNLPPPSRGLAARLMAAQRMFPCNLLFVHRDTEGRTANERYAEIDLATARLDTRSVSIVPIRMTEAWLLTSESAIRKAAGNPNGRHRLNLPRMGSLETLADPKAILLNALTDAANLGARRRASFDAHAKRRRVAECVDDFSPLRQLVAYNRFESDIRAVIPAILN